MRKNRMRRAFKKIRIQMIADNYYHPMHKTIISQRSS